ncbi:hypothetical protein PDIDSM_6139 [Penicillium digitatum]|nr:hypothetical protein PDIDSM_6139 [Penicillium digitatum]
MTFVTYARTSRQPSLHSVGDGTIVAWLSWLQSSIGRMMQYRPRSGECAVFSLLARIAVVFFQGSPIGRGETGEANDDDKWEVEAFANKQPRVDLRRQGLCNVTSGGA